MDDSIPVEVSLARFRALGDPIRLAVVRELAAGPCCVCDLRARVQVAGPLLSHHLGVLRDAGLVTASRRGRWIDYALDHDAVTGLLTAVTPEASGADR